ncbi:prolyl oligopeptidase family serine peptidase [Sediminibacterium ginsengisoli]|uniref:prolyl oligopeptidase n=1 Tax=Sediminibacterium ginsengisoli TaxID=413434 RepID=A0A1T4RKN4_9BACT|nr:prolyl oligopeptidase family serine peptidase [Sediminibacterium ginsengisoli]SKA16542.1 prolyl oligopeptidase Serine peptidase. MEROPS family S09A [Sediminibacterium ginsengisoli]
MKPMLLLCAGIVCLCACKQKGSQLTTFKPITVQYPVTEKDTTINDVYFGTRVADPYRWLEDDTSARTAAWVAAENKVTQDYLARIPFRDAIRKRYEHLFNYEKYSAPFKEGKYTYYYRNTGLQNQSVLYRETGDGKTPEVFLDPNLFSKDGTTSLAGISFTQDGSMAAYNISEGGSDWQKIIVLDAETKKQIGDTMQDVKFSGASWKGNEGFYYSTYNRPKEGSFLAGKTDAHKLYFHKTGTPQQQDQLVFGDKTQKRYVGGYVTEDQRWLIITAADATYGNELYVQDLRTPGSPVVPLVTDMKNSHYVIHSDDQFFYIQTDKDAPTGKLVTAPVNNPGMANWKTLVPARPEVLTSSTGGGFLFCSYLKDAVSKVYQHSMDGKMIREIRLPGLGTADGFGAKQKETELYYSFTSYIEPRTLYKLDIASGRTELYKQSKVEFKPSDYESKQVFYNSKDGTKIPMIITYKKGLELNGKNPCLLYGYGGFSVSITPFFSTSSMILLENGGILAVPNIRGGGEYGEEWHQQGIKTKKQNVFDDFVAAAQYLKDNKYTSSEYLALEGGSNGGLLVGACITQHPDMCKVAFPAVGVLDMLRYHKFTAGAGWAYDYGTSEESKEMFEYLYHYSPLHNVKATAYPATMITTADHDDRVVPAHSFKFAATLQEKHNGSNPVLIRIETKAGHGAGKSTQQVIDGETDKWSFMFYNIGLQPYYK